MSELDVTAPPVEEQPQEVPQVEASQEVPSEAQPEPQPEAAPEAQPEAAPADESPSAPAPAEEAAPAETQAELAPQEVKSPLDLLLERIDSHFTAMESRLTALESVSHRHNLQNVVEEVTSRVRAEIEAIASKHLG